MRTKPTTRGLGNASVLLLIGVIFGTFGGSQALGAVSDFPSRPVALVVPFPTGGGSDLTWRLFASIAQKYLGQPIEVQNIVGGANGSLGTAKVAVARPDGYTLVGTSNDSITIEPNRTKLPYSYKRFTALAQIDVVPYILAAGPRSPVKTVDELKIYARQNPNKLTVGVSGIGGSPHLAVANMLLAMGNLKLKYIPFEGSGQALAGVLGGNLDLMIGSIQTALPSARAGKLFPLFVTSLDPVEKLPNTPGATALGLAKASIVGWRIVFAPARTPVDVLDKLNGIFAKALADPEYKTKLLALGGEWNPSTNASEMNKMVAQENESIVSLLKTVFGGSR